MLPDWSTINTTLGVVIVAFSDTSAQTLPLAPLLSVPVLSVPVFSPPLLEPAYGWAGENIAAGSTTPAAVMKGWLASPGHCANILNPKFSQLGVGYAAGGPYGYYWTQSLASRK